LGGSKLTLKPVVQCSTDKEQRMNDYVMDLTYQLQDIHHYAHQLLKAASDQMACNDCLTNSVGLHERASVWLQQPGPCEVT
jgi:hypothetical protein